MAITKTIQATVKNRTDTAANWTSKNPVLAEGEIIVVQTSAGETRLKIGDGVKTFTQLPYTDEQIYNNVVTSVNGETGDVTLANDSKSLGLASAAVGQMPKIKAVDSNGVPTEWSPVDMPATLPNPNAITFTGAVTGTYDGSEAVTINIPEGNAGNMKKLTFTGAVTGEYDGTTDVNIDIPIATTSAAGTIKVGNGLSVSADGTLSVTTATYYTGTADPVNTLGADGDLYLKTEG